MSGRSGRRRAASGARRARSSVSRRAWSKRAVAAAEALVAATDWVSSASAFAVRMRSSRAAMWSRSAAAVGGPGGRVGSRPHAVDHLGLEHLDLAPGGAGGAVACCSASEVAASTSGSSRPIPSPSAEPARRRGSPGGRPRSRGGEPAAARSTRDCASVSEPADAEHGGQLVGDAGIGPLLAEPLGRDVAGRDAEQRGAERPHADDVGPGAAVGGGEGVGVVEARAVAPRRRGAPPGPGGLRVRATPAVERVPARQQGVEVAGIAEPVEQVPLGGERLLGRLAGRGPGPLRDPMAASASTTSAWRRDSSSHQSGADWARGRRSSSMRPAAAMTAASAAVSSSGFGAGGGVPVASRSRGAARGRWRGRGWRRRDRRAARRATRSMARSTGSGSTSRR